jgi:acyl-CoA thioester hydrolase
MKRDGFDHFTQFRVRYSEIDAQGIVYNAHYLTYFDVTITEYLRALAYDYDGMVVATGLDFHLVKATVEYRQPIVKDAEIEVGIACSRIGTTSVTWTLAIFPKGGDDVFATGEIVWVCSRVGAHKSHPLPDALVRLLTERSDLLKER